ncbi:unnamed protein product [Sphagnum balticum]
MYIAFSHMLTSMAANIREQARRLRGQQQSELQRERELNKYTRNVIGEYEFEKSALFWIALMRISESTVVNVRKGKEHLEETQKTPNPNFLKFVPTAKVVMGASDPVDIPSPEDAYRLSPLARKIFKVTGVTRIFYGKDYISIAKSEETNWN